MSSSHLCDRSGRDSPSFLANEGYRRINAQLTRDEMVHAFGGARLCPDCGMPCLSCWSRVSSARSLPRGESMQTRIVRIGAAIAVVAIALTVARTEAFAAKGESCSTTSTDVTSGPSSDGAEATCDAATTPPNSAKGSASGTDADATADASGGSNAKATSKGMDADATADASGGSAAKATSKGTDADATAGASGGSMAVSSAKGMSAFGDATAGTGSSAQATASGTNSDATSDASGGSMAVSSAKGMDSFADATAANGSNAHATASGTDSDAEADAEQTGTNVTALATKGSVAIGSDTNPPTCTPKNGGKAKVTSPMGNCP